MKMIVKALVENTSISDDFGSEHGLSLHIEAEGCNLLFDVGASDLFLKNAQKMGVALSEVDYLVISHGHNDHGGGLGAFLRENARAEVFVHRLAFEKHHANRPNGETAYIGLEGALRQHRQIVLTSDRFFIRKGIQLFSNVVQKRPVPASNSGLFVRRGETLERDEFAHEQNLVIESGGSTLLVTGCAHNGIINILEHFFALKKRMPDVVVGGFHLSSRSGGNESDDAIDETGRYLMDTGAKYYTCHCTGQEAYRRLKAVMGDRIAYLPAGGEITIATP